MDRRLSYSVYGGGRIEFYFTPCHSKNQNLTSNNPTPLFVKSSKEAVEVFVKCF